MTRTRNQLAGKVVAVTGGARGIGRATAAAFLAEGAKVAIGDVDTGLAKQTAADLGGNQGDVVGMPLDVTDPASFEAFLIAVEDWLGPLDVLVNNAGIMPTGHFVDEDPSMTTRMIDINVYGVVNGSRLAAARFVPRGSGHIVNIASLAGVTGEPGVATYCGTKHFVVGFTESLHRELADHGVCVSMVLPGLINTELSASAEVPRWAHRIAKAEPEDVAAGVVRAVVEEKPRVVVPAALGALIKTGNLMTDRGRHRFAHALHMDRMISGMDPEVRAAYHRRIVTDR